MEANEFFFDNAGKNILNRLSKQKALAVQLMLLLKFTRGEEVEILIGCNKCYHMAVVWFLKCALRSAC